jgi:DNA topoisomerase-1
MVVKWGRNGEFLACPNYPECKNTKNFKRSDGGAIEIAVEEEVNETCELCGRPMLMRFGKFGKFLGCSGYPECKNIQPLQKPVDLGIKCPECKEGNIKERKSRWGKVFYGCDRYPDCSFVLWNKPVAKACPDCKSPYLVEKFTKKDGRRLLCERFGVRPRDALQKRAQKSYPRFAIAAANQMCARDLAVS